MPIRHNGHKGHSAGGGRFPLCPLCSLCLINPRVEPVNLKSPVESPPMKIARPLLAVCVVALLHGLFFIWYQQPDWYTEWSDQDGYRRLGLVLAQTGKFTRFPDAPRFVPEVIRTPMYPAFVALVYKLFGPRQIAVALAQTALFAGICLLAYDVAKRATAD